jgi:hypothetical protein
MAVRISLIVMLSLLYLTVQGQKDIFFRKYSIPLSNSVLGLSVGCAQAIAPASYSWRLNTISQLGAQNYTFAPAMNAGFITHGALIGLKSAHDLIKGNGHWMTNAPLLLYGTSVTLLGFIHTVPFEPGIPYSQNEASLHGTLAISAIAGLTGAMIGNLAKERNPKKIPLHISCLGVVLFSSSMLYLDEKNKGAWERVLLMNGLTWLTLNYTIKL